MPGPLPESLRIGVYEANGHSEYGNFMRRVVALQEGTMSLEVVDNDVFTILGFDGGHSERYHVGLVRDASSKSHRPDLYRMFVEWSTANSQVLRNKKERVPFSFGPINIPIAMPVALDLDSLTTEVLVKDLIALDAALTMSPMMQTALRTGVSEPCLPLSFGETRVKWHNQLLKRVRTDM